MYDAVTMAFDKTDKPPYLAHYTSLCVLEQIMKNDEIWFSHPSFMNDLQEMEFGIGVGTRLFFEFSLTHEFEDACGSYSRAQNIRNFFAGHASNFDMRDASEIYVFCLSNHDESPGNSQYADDGLLSMWRGYGANGNGAALVFKTDFLRLRVDSPLVFAKVSYLSNQERRPLLLEKLKQALSVVKNNTIPEDMLPIVAEWFFMIVKFFALRTKHKGFLEEQEWRIIYLPDLDRQQLLSPHISYYIGPKGIEPKLKMKLEPLKLDPRETWTFHSILHKVILGPSFSSPLAAEAVRKMLKAAGKEDFSEKLCVSGIPFRAPSA